MHPPRSNFGLLTSRLNRVTRFGVTSNSLLFLSQIGLNDVFWITARNAYATQCKTSRNLMLFKRYPRIADLPNMGQESPMPLSFP
jgi:hypothetical protein